MKKFTLPIILILVSLIFLVIGVVPAFNNYQNAARLLKDKQKNQDQLSAKLDLLDNINEFQQDQELRLTVQALPVLAPYQQTLTLLDQLSQTHNIAISGLEITSEKTAISLKFTAAGELKPLKEFVLALNQSLPISVTDNIGLSASSFINPSASPSAYYNAGLEIAFQFKSTPSTIGKVSDPLPVISGNLAQTLEQLRKFNSIASQTPLSADQIPSDRVSKLFPE